MNELDLTKKENVVTLMKSSKTPREWDANCDKVKAANNNDYPNWWYGAIILSGVYSSTSMMWMGVRS